MEDRPGVLAGLAPDAAAMSFDNGSADRQANAHPVRFGAYERLEELRRDRLADAAAAILDADRDETPRKSPSSRS